MVRLLARRQQVGGAHHLGGVAHREPRRKPRRRHVLIEKRGRDGECGGDVLEAVHFDFCRQDLFGIELDAKEVVDRSRELGAAEPLRADVPGNRTADGPGVEPRLHPGHEGVDLLLTGLAAGWRGHQPAPHLAHRFFPHVGVVVHGVQRERVEGDAAGLDARVVAADAIGVECLARLLRTANRSRGRGAAARRLANDRGRQQGDDPANPEADPDANPRGTLHSAVTVTGMIAPAEAVRYPAGKRCGRAGRYGPPGPGVTESSCAEW